MVTISDVARAAGVSKATVSYVLSDDPRITEQTALKVRQAIDDLGYTVNHAARALSVKKTMTMGIVSPAYHGSYLSALFGLHVYLLSEQAAKYGYDTLFVANDESNEALKRAWASRKVDGFILMDVSDDDPRMKLAAKLKAPTVAFGAPLDSFGLDTVDADYAAEARSIVNCLADEGHREVNLLLWSRSIFHKRLGFAMRFYEAIVKAARDRGLTLHVASPEDDESDPSDAIRHALREHPKADAMVLHNESATIVAPQVFADLGLHVPHDLRIVTVFPKQLRESLKIPFDAVETDVLKLAETAVQLLMSRIANPDAPAVHQNFDFSDSLKTL